MENWPLMYYYVQPHLCFEHKKNKNQFCDWLFWQEALTPWPFRAAGQKSLWLNRNQWLDFINWFYVCLFKLILISVNIIRSTTPISYNLTSLATESKFPSRAWWAWKVTTRSRFGCNKCVCVSFIFYIYIWEKICVEAVWKERAEGQGDKDGGEMKFITNLCRNDGSNGRSSVRADLYLLSGVRGTGPSNC